MRKNNILPSHRLFFQGKTRQMIHWTKLFEHLFIEGSITKEDAKTILLTANKFFESEPNLLYLQDPVTLVGDIHGLGGNPEGTKYLFLGDYVDRGIYAVEVVLTLYALKINFPNTVFLLRGNHECRQMTAYHYFREECLQKFDQEIYDLMMESFDKLPIACIINGQFLALHGGISPDLKNCLEINRYNRFQEPPQLGTVCDILWADPVDNTSGLQNSIWEPNNSRGCSYYFGYVAINDFLKKNNLISLIRAHEAQYEGFKAYVWQNKDFPQVITIFSAPNYCGTYGNKGAVVKMYNNEMKVLQYNFTPKPDILLQLGDAFTWSIPLISKALMDMFIGFLSYTNDVVIEQDQIQNQIKSVDISMLDDTVLDALDIKKEEANDQQNQVVKANFLDLLVEDQKKKKKLGSKDLIQGYTNNKLKVVTKENQGLGNDILDQSMPETFQFRKYEDSFFEKRPE